MKVAIVHEMLIKLGGAEKVLEVLMEMYPDADVYTFLYDEKKVGHVFPAKRIICCGWAQRFFLLTHKPRWSLPLMPFSVPNLRHKKYDFVISSSSGFAHGVKTMTKHVCYCHSPARYLWDWTENIQKELGVISTAQSSIVGFRRFLRVYIVGSLVRMLFVWLRWFDLRASRRPDLYVANSAEVAGRINRYYGRSAQVLWPPIDIDHFSRVPTLSSFSLKSQSGYYVLTSALTPFKRVDIAILAFNALQLPLKIIGSGDQEIYLRSIAGPTIQFLGRLSDDAVLDVYAGARGFIMPQKEDAGMTPIEALAAGLPVFGQGAGGLLEVIRPGLGACFSEESVESFLANFSHFHDDISHGIYDDHAALLRSVEMYRRENFITVWSDVIRSVCDVR